MDYTKCMLSTGNKFYAVTRFSAKDVRTTIGKKYELYASHKRNKQQLRKRKRIEWKI